MKRALILLALLFAACSSEPVVRQGVITEKHYDDPDDSYTPGYTIDGGQTCTGGYGNPPSPRVCTDNPDTNIPGHWDHDPAHWRLRLQADIDGKRRQSWVDVSRETYDEARVGQAYDADTDQITNR